LLVIGVMEHRGQCPPKGEGSIITLVKNPCNKVNNGKIIIVVMGHLFQDKFWVRNPSVGVHLVYYG